MEFANIKYITYNGETFFKEDCCRVPSYEQAKSLEPVIVDDLLRLNEKKEDVSLFRHYVEDRFQIVPIHRITDKNVEGRYDFPTRVLLEISSKCNLKCVMCPRNALKRPKIHMPKEVVMRCIDEINNHGIDGLWLYYLGNSLLHPDFEEIFNYCRDKKNLGSLWLSTNGQGITDRSIDMFFESNLTFLNYSLNAMNAQSYRMLSPLGDYENLVSTLNRLLKRKQELKKMGLAPWVRVQMIDQPQVKKELDSFLSFYSQNCEILSINVLQAFSQDIAQNTEYARQRKRGKKLHCNRLNRNDCFIFSDGEVSFCDTDFNHEMSIGSIYNSTIEQIWNGPVHRKYESLNREGRLDDIPLCSRCFDYDL